MSALSAFDVIVLILMALGAVAGLARGFVTEVLSLLAWVAGIFAVRYFFADGKAMAERLTGTATGGAILAFVVIFVIAYGAVQAIAGSAGSRTKASVIGPLDRLLGLGFGGVKGLLVASVLFLLGGMTFDVLDPGHERPDWLNPVRTGPLVEATSHAMVTFYDERRARADATRAVTPPA